MNYLKRIYLPIIILLLSTINTYAQNYPIRVNTLLSSPYPLYLSDYYNNDNKLRIQVLALDKSIDNLKIKLHMTIEGQNIKIETSKNYHPAPIFLTSTELISGVELSELFKASNLEFTGMTRADYANGGKLPEGIYTFTFTVMDYNRGTILSNKGYAIAWLMLNEPPLLVYPEPNAKLKNSGNQTITFQWTPRNTGSPNSTASTVYTFYLFESGINDISPNALVNSKEPIYKESIKNTFLVYTQTEQLQLGKKYFYYVQAEDENKKDIFRNKGKSEVREFTFGEECKAPKNIELSEINGPGVSVKWQQEAVHTAFTLEIGTIKDNIIDWNYSENTASTKMRIFDNISNGKTYKCRVMASCFSYNSSYSLVSEIKISDSKKSEPFSCTGINNYKVPTNKNLKNNLKTGDEVTVGGFKAKIVSISSTGNTFSGEALVEVPFFSRAKIKQKFENIKINTANEIIEGKFSSIRSDKPTTFTSVMENTWDNVKSQTNEAINETNNNLNELENLSDDAKNKASDAINQVPAAINKTVEENKNTLNETKENIENKVNSTSTEVINKANQIQQDVKDKAQSNVDNVSNTVTQTKEDIENKATNTANDANNAANQIQQDAQNKAQSTSNNLTNTVNQNANNLQKDASKVQDNTKTPNP